MMLAMRFESQKSMALVANGRVGRSGVVDFVTFLIIF